MDNVNVDMKLETDSREGVVGKHPLEDRALKLAAQFFGRELLPRIGIREEIRRIAPTEQIHLEVKGFLEDFNLEMVSGKWYHFEFASKPITKKDLMKFRSYEAVTGFYYGVEVITCVICTAHAKKPKVELKQGINRYRVLVIYLSEKDGDEVIRKLEEKRRTCSLDRSDLAELLLTPLMSGKLEISERIERSIRLIQKEREILSKEDLLRMESVLYTFAMKFLSNAELENMKEVFGVTVLGQMLEEWGMEKGMEKGIRGNIKHYKKLGFSRDDTQKGIISEFDLTAEMAEKYLIKYWEE